MNLICKINEFHEKYVFSFATGFGYVYFMPTCSRLIGEQQDFTRQRELFLKYGRYIGDFNENIESTRIIHQMGMMAGIAALLELAPEMPLENKFGAWGLTNIASVLYELMRERCIKRSNASKSDD